MKVAIKLAAISLCVLVSAAASAQTWTQMQWFMDKSGGYPYPISLRIGSSSVTVGSLTSGGLFSTTGFPAFACSASNWVSSGASGLPVCSRPACADISNSTAACSTAIGTSGATIPLLNAANTWAAAQTYSAAPVFSTLTGYIKGNGASPATAASTVPSADVVNTPSGTGAVSRTLANKLQGILSVGDWGAVGDGVTDDTAAVQSFIDYLRTNGLNGACESGKTYRITSSLALYATSPFTLYGYGRQACTFYIDYNAWGSGAFDLTNPTSPNDSNRSASVTLRDINFSYNTALTKPPIAIKQRFSSDLVTQNVRILQYTSTTGTVLQCSNCWNARFQNLQIWGAGGYRSSHIPAPTTTFSITSGSTTLTSSAAEFSAADVGSYISLLQTTTGLGPNEETYKISGYTNTTTVTVDRTSSYTHTAVKGAFGPLNGTITSGTPTLTVSASTLTSNDIGRVIYIPGAGAAVGTGGHRMLRTTITNVIGTTITLADNASNSVTNVEIIIDPSIDIYAEGSSFPNDLIFDDLHEEQVSGAGIVAIGLRMSFRRAKVHGWNNGSATFGQTDNQTQAHAVFYTSEGDIDGELDGGLVSGEGSLRFSGMTQLFNVRWMFGAPIKSGVAFISSKFNDQNGALYVGDTYTSYTLQPGVNRLLVNTDNTSRWDNRTSFNVKSFLGKPFTVPSKAVLVANLLACTTDGFGATQIVSDGDAGLAPGEKIVNSGGGATQYSIVCNGTNWVVMDTTNKQTLAETSRSGFQNTTLTSVPRVFDGSTWTWDGSNLQSTILWSSVATATVTAATDIITTTNAHNLTTGNAVMVTSAINGLAVNTIYYVVYIDVTSFKLSDTWAHALAGTNIVDLTASTNFTLYRHKDPMQGFYVTPTTDLKGASGAWVRQEPLTHVVVPFFQADPTGTSASDQAIAGSRDYYDSLLDTTNGTYKGEWDFNGGTYSVTRSVNFANIGRGSTHYRGALISDARFISSTSDDIAIDATNSTFVKFSNVQYVVNNSASPPKYGFFMGRACTTVGCAAGEYSNPTDNEANYLQGTGWASCAMFASWGSDTAHFNTLDMGNKWWKWDAVGVELLGDPRKTTCASNPVSKYQTIFTGSWNPLAYFQIDYINVVRAAAFHCNISTISKAATAQVTVDNTGDCGTNAASLGLANNNRIFLEGVAGSIGTGDTGTWASSEWRQFGMRPFSVRNLSCPSGGACTFDLWNEDNTAAINTSAMVSTYGPTVTQEIFNDVGVQVYISPNVGGLQINSGYLYGNGPAHITYDLTGGQNADVTWLNNINVRGELVNPYFVRLIGDNVSSKTMRSMTFSTDGADVGDAFFDTQSFSGGKKAILNDLRLNIGKGNYTPSIGVFKTASDVQMTGQVRGYTTNWNPTPLVNSGSCAMTAGACSAQTFVNSFTYTSTPICIATYASAAAGAPELKAAATTTTVTPAAISGAGTETVNWACFGN